MVELNLSRRAGFVPKRGTKQSGGDFWNVEQLSAAVSVTKPSSRAKALSASRFQERKPTSSSITGFDWETAGKATSMSASKAWVLGSRLPFDQATFLCAFGDDDDRTEFSRNF